MCGVILRCTQDFLYTKEVFSTRKGNHMQNIKVGIGVIIITEAGKILLGKRLNAQGHGTWAPPGGHLEYGESFEECARREALEETGLTVGDLQQVTTINNVDTVVNNHGVTIFMYAQYIGGEPKVMEPEKCESWHWFDINGKLPEPLFQPFQLFINGFHEFCKSQE